MTTRKALILLFALVLILATPLASAGDPERATSEPATPSADSPAPPNSTHSLTTLPPEKVARLSPLLAQLRSILLAEKDRLAPLLAEFAEETDSLRNLEIQRRIQRIKQETEVSLMRAQADHARLNGRPEEAERIEEGLRRMAEQDEARREGSPNRSARSDRPGARR